MTRSHRTIRTAFAVWTWAAILALIATAAAQADTASWRGVDIPEVCQEVETVNLNVASQAELELLYRIGPVLAARIMDGRPYESVEDLDRVSGIGPATMAANLHYLSVSGDTTLKVRVPKPEVVEGAPTTWRRVERCQ